MRSLNKCIVSIEMDDTYMARKKTCLKDFKSGELENRAFMDVKNQINESLLRVP